MHAGILVVEPAVEALDPVHQSLRIGAEIRFPRPELCHIDGCLHHIVVQAAVRQMLQGLLHHPQEIILPVRGGVPRVHGEIRLPDAVIVAAVRIFPDAGLDQRLVKRRSRDLQQHIAQSLESIVHQRIQFPAHPDVQGEAGSIVLGFTLGDGVLHDLFHRRGEGLRKPDLRVHRPPVITGEIFAVDIGEVLRHVGVSVQIDEGIGRMIVAGVEIQIIPVGQLRDHGRISAGLLRIGMAREQRLVHGPLQNAVRGRIDALHLVVDDAVQRKRSISGLHLVVPALLPEDLLLPVQVRVEHRVQIDVHQVPEVRLIAARHRIDGLVRVGHGVQEGVERALHQLHKRIFGGILLRPAEDRVLHDVGHTGGIPRRGPESDGKHLVRIIAEKQKDPGTGLHVFHRHADGPDLRDLRFREEAVGRQRLQRRDLFCCVIYFRHSSLLFRVYP